MCHCLDDLQDVSSFLFSRWDGLDIVINGWSLNVITYLPPSAKIRSVWNFYPSPFFGVILSLKDSFIMYFKKYVLVSERRNVCPNQYSVVHMF